MTYLPTLHREDIIRMSPAQYAFKVKSNVITYFSIVRPKFLIISVSSYVSIEFHFRKTPDNLLTLLVLGQII